MAAPSTKASTNAASTSETPSAGSQIDPAPWGGWILALMLCLIGFPALDQYGVNWDEALGDFFFGQRYASYLTSFDDAYLDFDSNPYPASHRPDLSGAPFKSRPWEYYPVANTLAAATSNLLSGGLGWLDPYDGFHAFNLLLAALFILVFYDVLRRREDPLTAVVAVVLLFTSPRVFSHMMANIKDFPSMVMFSLTLLAFLAAWQRGSRFGLIGAGAVWGLALGTKANALFVGPIVLVVALLAGRPRSEEERASKASKLSAWLPWLGTLVAAGCLAGIVMVAVWPYLWADPVAHLQKHLDFLLGRKGTTDPRSVAPIFEALLFTTPPAFLALFLLGLGPTVLKARRRDPAALLWLVWIGVVLGRYLLPQAVNYDGVRHLLEFFPPMAAVAGIGLLTGARWLTRRLPLNTTPSNQPNRRQAVVGAMVAIALLPGSWALLASHPFQLAYWNGLVGGLGGAQAKEMPQAGDYWGLSYRQGLRWLNEHAPDDALLAVPVVEHAVRLVAPQRLRSDIALLPITTPFSPRIPPERLQLTRQAALDRPLYVMFVERRDWLNLLMVDCLRYLQPEVSWQLNGGNVLAIYRYPPELSRAMLQQEATER